MRLGLTIWLIPFLAACGLATSAGTAPTADGAAPVPGAGTPVEAASDDFEADDWSFDPAKNRSGNGLWRASRRGAPEMLRTVKPRADGLPGSTAALLIRTRDHDDDGQPMQEDLVSAKYAKRLDAAPVRADRPSLVAHLYLPPIEDAELDWAKIGVRIEASNNGRSYYPSIWIAMIQNPDLTPESGYPDYWSDMPEGTAVQKDDARPGYRVWTRLGDGPARDQMRGKLPGHGWYTLGIAFDEKGIGHYYIRQGVGPFKPAHKIHQTTDFAQGTDPRMDRLNYHFISIGGAPGPEITPAFQLDDITLFVNPTNP